MATATDEQMLEWIKIRQRGADTQEDDAEDVDA